MAVLAQKQHLQPLAATSAAPQPDFAAQSEALVDSAVVWEALQLASALLKIVFEVLVRIYQFLTE